jgi:hypothetical protein
VRKVENTWFGPAKAKSHVMMSAFATIPFDRERGTGSHRLSQCHPTTMDERRTWGVDSATPPLCAEATMKA